MEDSDSENEGQLLIDESVDASKKGRGGRKRGPVTKKTPQKKKSLKIVVKAPSAAPRGRKPKGNISKVTDNEPKVMTTVRTSTRTRKRVRKHSPSPVRKKKEPPKKKLKVKIKNIVKTGKKKKIPALPDAGPDKDPGPKTESVKPTQDLDNVDIESISDDELQDIQYSSVIVDEEPAEKAKIHLKPKKKAGIKLKLSLGKVLTPKIAETLDDIVSNKDSQPKDEISTLSSSEEERHVIKPLIISKRRVSGEMSPTNKAQVSIIPTGNESPYYSSSSEDHKPLTLRLSVGRPKIPKRSISELEKPVESHQKPFHNIQRSWSVTPIKTLPEASNATTENTSTREPRLSDLPKTGISSTPYFSVGLQSLLDVVSVELNEQNKVLTVSETERTTVQKQPSPPKSHPPASNISSPAFQKSPSLLHGHEGLLPSMSFPKPELHFSSKKRPRIKSVTNVSPQAPPTSNSLVENEIQSTDEERLPEESEEPPDLVLTEKERRRRDKKKALNDDFVDPDSIMQGGDVAEKKTVKKKPLPSYVPKSKVGGFSLLMPQMKSKPAASEPKPVGLSNATPFSFPNKNLPSKRPKKGMATTKQRLANKLKIGRTFAY